MRVIKKMRRSLPSSNMLRWHQALSLALRAAWAAAAGGESLIEDGAASSLISVFFDGGGGGGSGKIIIREATQCYFIW